MKIDSADIHPMRYMRTRPFARDAVRLYTRTAGRGIPTMETMERMQQLVFPSYNEAIARLPFEKRPERPTAMIVQECSLAFHVGAFTAFGRNVYLLAPRLVGLLDRTDLDTVRCGDIRPPSGALYLAFGNAFDAALPGPPNRIDGAYVNWTSPDRLQVVVTSRRLDARADTARRWPMSRDLYYYAPLDVSDAERSFADVLAAAVRTDIALEPSITEPDPDETVQLADGREVLVQDVRDLTGGEAATYNQEGLPAFRRAFSLAVNALCYLSAEPDETAAVYPDDAPSDLVEASRGGRPAQRDRATSRLLDQGYTTVRILGSSLDTGHPPAPTRRSAGEVAAHWRRGHWRRQPVGTGRAERRLTWIRPTLVRGDKGEPEGGHIYHVE